MGHFTTGVSVLQDLLVNLLGTLAALGYCHYRNGKNIWTGNIYFFMFCQVQNRDFSQGQLKNRDFSQGQLKNRDFSQGQVKNHDFSQGQVQNRDFSQGQLKKTKKHGIGVMLGRGCAVPGGRRARARVGRSRVGCIGVCAVSARAG